MLAMMPLAWHSPLASALSPVALSLRCHPLALARSPVATLEPPSPLAFAFCPTVATFVPPHRPCAALASNPDAVELKADIGR